MQLEINREECDLLIEVLTSSMSELRFEVGNTDDHDYRHRLKAREALLVDILDKLNEASG